MLIVSKSRCVGCGLCEEICPHQDITLRDDVAVIDNKNCVGCQLCARQCPQNAIDYIDSNPITVAFGSNDGKTLASNGHFGASQQFIIYTFTNGKAEFMEQRKNVKYQEDETQIHGDAGKAKAVSSVLKGIDVIVSRRIGPNISKLKNKYVCAVVRKDSIEQAVQTVSENLGDVVAQKNNPDKKGIVLF